ISSASNGREVRCRVGIIVRVLFINGALVCGPEYQGSAIVAKGELPCHSQVGGGWGKKRKGMIQTRIIPF
ncbi:MAG: hypothetical protein DYG96_07940, partial [Chlorobi bacterium CHB2]|nr:hypothetical protein [Chlorobi bacterium CHB2]